ncbi:MAG: 4Fe-4S binding protein [Pseudomonadota bacterium]
MNYQPLRLWTRTAFFTLFVLAPPLDIFRLDLTRGNFILFGQDWTLGLAAFQSGEIGAVEAALNLISRGFIPIALIIGLGVWVAWRYGRLYCGWLCPHFSVVEMINALMRRASGKPSLWEREPLPQRQRDGTIITPARQYWLWTAFAILGFAFLWALSLLTYLLPPEMIYHNLLHGELTRNQALFLGVATLVLSLEFLLARHLFCRFGCAIGLFQSLAWMANNRALLVHFDRVRGAACKDCTQDCDHACPMRLNPRKSKRHMFTCTQCTRCVAACERVQAPGEGLLHWREGDAQDHKTAQQAPIHFIRRAK